MGSIRTRKENGLLMFDFRYQGKRCREQSMLPDTPDNRRKMVKVLKRIEAEITLGTFAYEQYFPNSPIAKQIVEKAKDTAVEEVISSSPLFKKFAWEWFEEMEIQWKRSYRATQKINLNCYLISVRTSVTRMCQDIGYP